MLSRRDFGALSLLTTCTRSFFNQSLFELASPITQISEIVKSAHPLLTKEGIEIIFDLVAKRALYEKNFENLLDPSLGMHDQRMLTPSEEAQQYAYYSRRFENMKCKNEIFGRAFAPYDQNGPFTDIVKDYERHCREQFLEVEVETESLINKYILDPTARNSFIFRLRELREELMQSADLERQIDAFQDKMFSLEINIESCIGQGWSIPISLFTSEIEDGCSADDVMRVLLDDDEIDADHAQNCREQIRYYEPIARDICQCKRFRPLRTYLNGGRGAEIFGSIRDLAETAGAGVIEEEVGEASFYLSHFHLSAYDWRSARLFPNRDKGSVEEFLEYIFGLFCIPAYQSHIRDGCGFDSAPSVL